MVAIVPRQNRLNLIRSTRTVRFRNSLAFLSKKNNNLLFMNGALANPYIEYEAITTPLVDGTYKFKIVSLDALGNKNSGVEKTATVSKKLWLPVNFRITGVAVNDVSFAWSAPEGGRTPVSYVIYGNGGAGYVIDRLTPLGTFLGTAVSGTVTVLDGDWLFVIETKDGTGETISDYSLYQTVPLSAIIPASVNSVVNPSVATISDEYSLQNVQLSNVSVGKCRIKFLWTYGTQASYFRIYHDSGTGTINWAAYAFRYARQDAFVQNFVTDQIASGEAAEYKFGIRAESSYGVVEENTIEYSVQLDGTSPDEVEDASAEAT